MVHRARCMSVVVHTPDVVGERMAGPGIRAWHIARELSALAPTTLVAKREHDHAGLTDTGMSEQLRIVEHGSGEAEDALREAAILFGQPARGFRRRRREQKVIHDMFDPTVLELRELYGSAPSLRQRIHLGAEWWRLAEALLRADLLVCASGSQRRFYGSLQGGDAPWIEVPFGLDPEEIRSCVTARDRLVLWGGGIWEWLDPAAAVDAVVRLNAEGLETRLLFLGRRRPNRELVDRRRDDRFDDLLRRGGTFVAANEEWVAYRGRLSWLRAARVAIMLHRRTAEAEYSIRTRLFDAIAAATPVVASAGGFAAELVEKEGLGIVVPPEDGDAVTAALRKLLTDDAFWLTCVQNLERVRPRFAWSVVTRPLILSINQWLN
jgi:glycosyltransferase involved in cell wall biosynthesis